MSAALLQEEAALRSRLATLEADNLRLRKAMERVGISPDAPIQQITEMISMREHLAIVDTLKRSLRQTRDELTRERARTRAHYEQEAPPIPPADEIEEPVRGDDGHHLYARSPR